MNIEDHPDFDPTAKRWAHAYLAAAEFRAEALYAPFPYTLAAFRKRTQAIYDSQLRRMHAPHAYDEALYVWSDGRRLSMLAACAEANPRLQDCLPSESRQL